ncbi:B box and SPRY domain-containing protein-like [Polypterus senegalus]
MAQATELDVGPRDQPNDKTEKSRAVLSGAEDPDGDLELTGTDDRRCSEHRAQLDWFCWTEDRLVCSKCAITGECKGHRVTSVGERASSLRNKLVDLCEKLQLKRSAVERFTEVTLPARKVAVQADASAAREVVVQRFNLVRDACEEEEQRLLEVIHGEEERANQNGLTQRAHWAESLQLISSIRDHLVSALTEMDDHDIVMSTKKILEKAEDADHVLEPLDSKQLDFDSSCTRSPLLLGMWATAALMCRAAPATLAINEKTVSPLLGISADLRTLTFLPKRERKPCEYSPERFDEWPNALAVPPFSSGVVTWLVEVKGSSAYKLGVTYSRLARKGKSSETRLGYNVHSWVLSHYEGDYCFSHAGHHRSLHLLRRPSRVGVLLDYAAGQLLFFDPESCAILHSHHGQFEAPLYPAFAVADRSITLLCS